MALAVLQGHVSALDAWPPSGFGAQELALNVDFQAQQLPQRPDDVSYTRAVLEDARNRGVDSRKVYCVGADIEANTRARLVGGSCSLSNTHCLGSKIWF